MEHWQEELPFASQDLWTEQIFTERALFFDIETTGFSSARTSLYLIGCAARKKDQLLIDQFYAASPAEELDILSAFLDYLKNFDTIITFNGIGFDIPYLTAKCETYQIPEPFSAYTYVDIYKSIFKFRFLFAMPNFKQKTIEQFLGLNRIDTYDGGELIRVYKSCQKASSPALISLLKQHNYEDVTAMPKLLSMLAYPKLFDGAFSVLSMTANEFISYDGTLCRELLFSLQNHFPVPKRVSCHYEDFHLIINTNQTTLCVKLFTGELKHFFSDYKNYYYLRKEDTAIPAHQAESVPKEQKKKATASTCYEKKNAIFLPQYQELQKPAFRHMFRDKKSYFALSEALIASKELQKNYCLHVLSFLCHKK